MKIDWQLLILSILFLLFGYSFLYFYPMLTTDWVKVVFIIFSCCQFGIGLFVGVGAFLYKHREADYNDRFGDKK